MLLDGALGSRGFGVMDKHYWQFPKAFYVPLILW